MSEPQKGRIAYFDNLRFFLIVTVVVGHFINPVTEQSDLFKSLFSWIYSFHMPLFLFLSGLFHKNKNILLKVLQFLAVGYLLKIGILLVSLIMKGRGSLSYYGMDGVPWYMFVLAGYTALSYLLRKVDKRFILGLFLVLGLFSGYDPTLGDTLFASRFIVFYPFFVLGEMLSPDAVLKTVRNKWFRVFGALVLAGWAALCFFKMKDVMVFNRLFTGRFPFGDRYGVWGCLYRGLAYILTLAAGFGVMCVIPGKKMPVITCFGSRTLQIYFWHIIIRDILVNKEVLMHLSGSLAGKGAILLFGVGCAFVLGLKVFGFPTTPIAKACRYTQQNKEQS